jgi:hypothetical protein
MLWLRPRRFDGLFRLGISRELAANTAGSNRDPWYFKLPNMLGTQLQQQAGGLFNTGKNACATPLVQSP